MSKTIGKLILQMILCVAAIISVMLVKSHITGAPLNIPIMLILSGSAIAGLLIAYNNGRLK